MSTSSQSSASAAAYDISNAAAATAATAADGVLIHEHQQQQQQQYPASSLSQRFHPYLMPYGRDSGALLPSAQSSSSSAAAAATCADYNLNRGPPQPHLPDHHGAGMTDAGGGGGGGDTPFSGRRTQLHHQVQTGPSGGTTNSASSSSSTSRRLREFIPDHKKDDEYWMKRQKNNEAAKRSREKRRINDMAMTKKILELTTDNKRLRLELEAIKRKYGLLPDAPFPVGGDGDDDVPLDRSVSPVYVGISSSDDSTPPSSSSFPFYQPVSPSPPVLDQFYHQESSLMVVDRRDNPDGTSLLPAVPAAAPRHYQSAEGSYRHPVAGQHAVLQQNVSMQNQPVASLKSVPFAEENVPVVRPLQSYSSTSTCTPARIGYLQLETPGGGDDDDDDDVVFSRGDGGKQTFDSMIRSSSLTDELLLSSSSPTISLAPPVASCGGGGGSLGQEYFQQPPRQRVTTSTSEIPLLTFSDLSSDDDDDVTVCLRKRSLLSPEAPLNLTKRSLSWQPPSSARFPLPNSNCGASGRPAASSSLLRNDTRSFRAAFQLQALPYHELWTEVSSKDSIENYSVQTLQQQQQRGAYLQDSRDSGEILSQYHQPPRPSMFAVKKTGANAAIKVEGADNLPSVAASTKNLKGYSDASCYEGRDEPSFLSDLATDSIDSVAQNSSRQVRGGVPLKVWHKMSLLSTAAGNSHAEKRDFQNTSMAASTTTVTSDAGFMYDDQSGDLLVDTSPNSPNTSGDSVDCASEFSDSDSTQARCRRDRAPDPPAGRRTRKSRKQLAAGLNLTAATILESENNKLKEELRSLSREVTDLKEIIGKKRKDSCNGNPGLGPYERIETDT